METEEQKTTSAMLLENLPRSIGMWGETAAVLLFTCSLGLGLARLAHPAKGPRCTCSGGCGQTRQLGTAPLSAEPRCCCCDRESAGQHCRAASSSAAPLQWTTDQETGSWLLTENVGCTWDQRAALVTQTWFIYLHSAKHNHYETKRRQFAPQEETVPVCAASKQLQVRSQAISQASAALENVLVSL